MKYYKISASMRLFCFVFIMFFPFHLFSQTVADYKKMQKTVENCPQNVIQMPVTPSHPDISKTPLPLSEIIVKDVKEDTGYIGIQARTLPSLKHRRLLWLYFPSSFNACKKNI